MQPYERRPVARLATVEAERDCFARLDGAHHRQRLPLRDVERCLPARRERVQVEPPHRVFVAARVGDFGDEPVQVHPPALVGRRVAVRDCERGADSVGVRQVFDPRRFRRDVQAALRRRLPRLQASAPRRSLRRRGARSWTRTFGPPVLPAFRRSVSASQCPRFRLVHSQLSSSTTNADALTVTRTRRRGHRLEQPLTVRPVNACESDVELKVRVDRHCVRSREGVARLVLATPPRTERARSPASSPSGCRPYPIQRTATARTAPRARSLREADSFQCLAPHARRRAGARTRPPRRAGTTRKALRSGRPSTATARQRTGHREPANAPPPTTRFAGPETRKSHAGGRTEVATRRATLGFDFRALRSPSRCFGG